MNLKRLQKSWDELGKTDPCWAILTRDDKKGEKWDLDEFFKYGQKEIDEIMNYISSLGIKIPQRKRALDFGCGVGRLTQALTHYFDEVYGVDIAPSMIELARKYNRYGNKCNFYLNETNNLDLFPDNYFDFICSILTLQHMTPYFFKNYIKEFLRVLAPHGLLIFQLPTERSELRKMIKHFVPRQLLDLYRKMRYGKQSLMEMHGMDKGEVVKFLTENNAKIVDIREDMRKSKNWISYIYLCNKKMNTDT